MSNTVDYPQYNKKFGYLLIQETKNSKPVRVNNYSEFKIDVNQLEEVKPDKLVINTLYFFDKKVDDTPAFFNDDIYFKEYKDGKAIFTAQRRTELKNGKFVGEFVTQELEVPLNGSVKIFHYTLPHENSSMSRKDRKDRKNRKASRINRKATRKNRTSTRKNRDYRRLL